VLFYNATVLGSLAFLAVAARVFIAIRQRTFGYDDMFACLACCMAVPNFVGLANAEIGRDIWTLTPDEITTTQKVPADSVAY